MTIQEIQRTLSEYDFKVGRICSVSNDSPPQADEPNRVVRNASIVTKNHGIVWQGDLELTYEGHQLGCAAREIGENFFIVEASAAANDDGSNPKNLIKQAIWWTSVGETDADVFEDVETCFRPRQVGQEPCTLTFDQPGSNWAGKILFRESCNQLDWLQEVSTHRGKRVMARLWHRCGPYELVWFDHGKAVLFHDYDAILRRFDKIKFHSYPDKRAIQAQNDGQLVALLWPSPLPNPETASAGMHELAMRRFLGPNERLTNRELKELIITELRPAVFSHDARKLYTAAARIMYFLDGSRGMPEDNFNYAKAASNQKRD